MYFLSCIPKRPNSDSEPSQYVYLALEKKASLNLTAWVAEAYGSTFLQLKSELSNSDSDTQVI